MATVTLRDEDRSISDPAEIASFLETFGIWYRRFEGGDALGEDATNEEILSAYDAPIQALMKEGGYVTADVINITPDIPNLDAMLAKFDKEHWHDEDEVRFIVGGSGLFHVNPKDGPIFSIEVVDGDMINVPEGTLHWFHLCQERAIRAIRLFKSKAGWTPCYTASGVNEGYVPMCFGPSYLPPAEG
jgi:1,2-dihydroxy-3-keto-5-methylthiopentene dioxygenase